MEKQHHENLKLLEKAIKLVQLGLRRYISLEDEQSTYIYTKLLSHLISSWAEVRVLKLAYERSAFTEDEIKDILTKKKLQDKWITALKIAICKAYSISKPYKIQNKLSFTLRQRYNILLEIINNDLLESYELRNRIAHGQWLFAFMTDLSKVSTNLTGKLRLENIVQLQLKYKMFKSLSKIIHDLAVSPPTFDRDFDENFHGIEEQRNNLHNRKYDDYQRKMIEKYQRGLAKRRAKIEN